MSDTKDPREEQKYQETPVGGTIINATAHRRPRVHAGETERLKISGGLNLLRDVALKVNVVLSDTKMSLGDVLALETESVVQLDKLSGDPVDIYVQDQKLGKGEVVVLQGKLRVRVLEIVPPSSGAKGAQVEKAEGE